jgi:hypothetical protein
MNCIFGTLVRGFVKVFLSICTVANLSFLTCSTKQVSCITACSVSTNSQYHIPKLPQTKSLTLDRSFLSVSEDSVLGFMDIARKVKQVSNISFCAHLVLTYLSSACTCGIYILRPSNLNWYPLPGWICSKLRISRTQKIVFKTLVTPISVSIAGSNVSGFATKMFVVNRARQSELAL